MRDGSGVEVEVDGRSLAVVVEGWTLREGNRGGGRGLDDGVGGGDNESVGVGVGEGRSGEMRSAEGMVVSETKGEKENRKEWTDCLCLLSASETDSFALRVASSRVSRAVTVG
jgi:hypothetical protein